MVDLSDIRRLMRPISGRVKGMIRRATLGTLNTTGLGQTLQAGTTKGDEDDDVELFEPFGFTSGPPAGSEGIVWRVGGERAGSVAGLFGNRTTRLAGVAQNESAVYNLLASIVLRVTGNIEINPGEAAGLIQLGGPTATEPVVLGTLLQTALNTYASTVDTALTTVTDAHATLELAQQTYFAIPLPTPAQQTTFTAALATYATAMQTYGGAVTTATTSLATAIGLALSQESFAR